MQNSFEELKQNLIAPPVLAFFDFESPFFVQMDASSVLLCSIIYERKENNNLSAIQFANRTMTAAERNYPAC